jgi:hypothetical protein
MSKLALFVNPEFPAEYTLT